MAKLNRVAKSEKEYDSMQDLGISKSVEMVLTTADTNRSIPIPEGAAFIEVYSSSNCRISLASTLAAKSTVSDTNATANDLAEGHTIIANTLTARQLSGVSTERTLYVRSATAGCTVTVNFCG